MSIRSRRPCLLLLAAVLAAAPVLAQPPWLAPTSDGRQPALPVLEPAIPSPAEVLGYPLGERFTHHERILDYFSRLAAASPRVELWSYGTSYEGRPLMLAAIGSPATIARLDEIRAARAALADPARLAAGARQELIEQTVPIVWLGYGVHGNESSSAEAAMAAAWVLAAGQGEIAAQLDDLLVLVDPLLNPDGRERYVHFFESRRGRLPDPDPAGAEHQEPWPGGRGNHYAIDLNRDWAWASQTETRQRIAEFRRWEPQVYVDYHEMSADATYFFPPPADPVHPAIGAASRALLEAFGRANASAFDSQGWTYYVGEDFDLFYPAYGDTYPSLRGGIGMTYEVAGSGRAGLTLDRRGEAPLTLADRIARHLTTSLATVATAAGEADRLVSHFVAARVDTGPERTFLWRAEQPEAAALAELLRLHGIEVGRLTSAQAVDSRSLDRDRTARRSFPAGTWVVSTRQPLGRLAAALLERHAAIDEAFLTAQRARVSANLPPQFYDVTAWSLPLAYGIEAAIVDGPPPGAVSRAEEADAALPPPGRLGLLVPPQGIASYRFAAALQRREIPLRLALDELAMAGRRFPAGTLFVPRATAAEGDDLVRRLGAAAGVVGWPVESSFSESGIPLGSGRMAAIRPARIALLRGEGLDPTSFGSLWHLLDRLVEADHTVLEASRIAGIRLADFDVLVLPDGRYDGLFDEAAATAVASWVRAGGTLVAIGGAAAWAADAELVESRRRDLEQTGENPEDADADGAPSHRFETELFTPGAVVATEMSHHPLTSGLAAPPSVLFWGSAFHDASDDPQRDLLRVAAEDPLLAGFAWPEAREQLPGALLAWVEPAGSGQVVAFAQEPSFRLFWRGTMPLLLNATLYGPSL